MIASMYLRAAGFAVVTLCASAASLSAARFGDFLYETQFGEAIITGYDGADGSVVIPAMINGQAVTEIALAAFSGQTNIVQIQLPESLLFIRDEAFQNCTSLTNIAIPAGVMEVGEAAFRGCTSLSEVKMAEGVSLLFESAFADCALVRVALPDSLQFVDPDVFAGNSGLAAVYFLGDAPTLSSDSLGAATTAYFFDDAIGFASPTWEYATGSTISTVNLGQSGRVATWLLTDHLDAAGLLENPDAAPQPPALSYAFNQAPGKPLFFDSFLDTDSNVFEFTYYAGQDGVSYQPMISSDLIRWGDTGVSVSPMDTSGFRTATVDYHGEPLFFNVQVTVSQ